MHRQPVLQQKQAAQVEARPVLCSSRAQSAQVCAWRARRPQSRRRRTRANTAPPGLGRASPDKFKAPPVLPPDQPAQQPDPEEDTVYTRWGPELKTDLPPDPDHEEAKPKGSKTGANRSLHLKPYTLHPYTLKAYIRNSKISCKATLNSWVVG